MKFQPKIDQFSLTALLLKVYTDNPESNVNAATAFFYKKKEDIYLKSKFKSFLTIWDL